MSVAQFHKVLFVGAHPDDEFACAGTLARLADCGAQVDVMAFSDCAEQVPAGFDLVSEWHQAVGSLKATPSYLGSIPARRFSEHRQEILQALVDRRDDGYDLVLLPASSDIHQDHSVVREEGIRAFKHTTILGYPQSQNAIHACDVRAFVALNPEHVDAKVRHARTYLSQGARIYFREDVIRGEAAVRGMQMNGAAAEAFEVVRWVMQ